LVSADSWPVEIVSKPRKRHCGWRPRRETRKPAMRILFGIGIAAVFAVAVWWAYPPQAKQYHPISMDPLGMMTTTFSCKKGCTVDRF